MKTQMTLSAAASLLLIYAAGLYAGDDTPRTAEPVNPTTQVISPTPPANPGPTDPAKNNQAKPEEGVRVLNAADLGLRRKGKFPARLIGREVAQFNRLQLRIEEGVELTSEQKVKIAQLFEKAKHDARTDKIDPTLRDTNPQSGLEIPEGRPAGTCSPAPAANKDLPASPPKAEPKADTEPAKEKAESTTPRTSEAGATRSVSTTPGQRVTITLPPETEPVHVANYAWDLADQIRTILDEKQTAAFDPIFSRWTILHPAGMFDGPFPRYTRALRDPKLGMAPEKQMELIKMMAQIRKDSQPTDTEQRRAERAAEAKTKLIERLTDEERTIYLATLAELEKDDEMAERERNEYKEKGVRVGS